MKTVNINPFAKISSIGDAVSATMTKSIYLGYVDNTRPITATITTTGTQGGATLTAKFVDSADDSTYADVTGGGFTNQTATGTETITFNLGTNIASNTGSPNYGKFLSVEYSTSGGTSTDLEMTVTVSGIGMPEDSLTFKLYN